MVAKEMPKRPRISKERKFQSIGNFKQIVQQLKNGDGGKVVELCSHGDGASLSSHWRETM